MAFNTAPGRAEYTAIATQTVFSFVFKIYLDADVKVYLTPAGQTPNDVADLLIIATDYSVSINGDNGGDVTLNVGANINDLITIVRSLDIDRQIEYQNRGDLLADTLNVDQNYQTYLIADQEANSDRQLTFSDTVRDVSNELPSPEASKVLGWNSAETALENKTVGDDSVFINIYNVDTITELLAQDPTIYSTINARGYHEANDDGGDLFNYDSTIDKSTANGGTIFDPDQSLATQGDGVGNGAWIRQNDKVTVEQFGASITSADNAFAIQKAINFTSANKLPLIARSGTYIIGSQGIAIGGKEYGLLLKSNTNIIGESDYNTIFKMKDEANIALINTDRTARQSNITLRNLLLDGNEANQTGTDTFGFNLYLYDVQNVTMNNLKSLNPKAWGFRLQRCDDIQIDHIIADHSAESASDGLHFVDCSNVTGGNFNLVTLGDDALAIEANALDIKNYALSNIYVSANTQLVGVPGRGITIFNDFTTVAAGNGRKIENISISSAVAYNCKGPGFNLTDGKFENIDVEIISDGCRDGAYVSVRDDAAEYGWYLKNSRIKLISRDSIESGLTILGDTTISSVSIENIEINAIIKNPGDGFHGASIRNTINAKGSIELEYDPAGTKVSSNVGVVLYNSGHDLSIGVDGGGTCTNCLYIAESSSNININPTIIKGGSVANVSIRQLSTDITLNGGTVIDDAPEKLAIQNTSNTTYKCNDVSGLHYRQLAALDLSVLGDGSVSFPHGIGRIPQYVNLQARGTVAINIQAGNADATNIPIFIKDMAGVAITTGSYNAYIEIEA